MKRLYQLGEITGEEFSQYGYSNSLVKAHNPLGINPYYVGCGILEDIEERWNKGQYGEAWTQCRSIVERQNWDTKEGGGWEKVLEVVKSYNDWFLLQEFLTDDLVDKLDLYIYEQVRIRDEVQLRRTKHTIKEIKELIVMSYGYSHIPSIAIVDGRNDLFLQHNYFGMELDSKYAIETMKHLQRLWGTPIHLKTVIEGEEVTVNVDGTKATKS
jgi:stage V sporulation protein R